MEEHVINKTISRSLSTLAFIFCVSAGCVFAQDKATPAVEAEAPTTAEPGFNSLLSLWVRPDGGYLLAIRGVDTNGRLDAAYANPHHLLFSKAEASREDNTIKIFLELSTGGYNGSTYSLTYDPENDVLRGVYYQAVAQQRFDVYFERSR
jgi:hypothetical protein